MAHSQPRRRRASGQGFRRYFAHQPLRVRGAQFDSSAICSSVLPRGCVDEARWVASRNRFAQCCGLGMSSRPRHRRSPADQASDPSSAMATARARRSPARDLMYLVTALRSGGPRWATACDTAPYVGSMSSDRIASVAKRPQSGRIGSRIVALAPSGRTTAIGYHGERLCARDASARPSRLVWRRSQATAAPRGKGAPSTAVTGESFPS